MDEGITRLFSFSSTYITAIGYDAQRALLEVRTVNNGRLKRYLDVPEEVWYQFRESADPDMYYRRCICGHFREMTVRAGEHSKNKMEHSKNKFSIDKKRVSVYTDIENGSQ